MTNMALETDALGKRYGRTWALQECSLHLPAGRIAGLAGPNGAGKSTLLHLAVGLLRPDAGQVRVFGQDPRNNTAVLREVGFVAQDTPLYRDFTAADLITLGGKLNSRWDAAFARERIGQLDIPLKKPVGKLSGGQRAQVALALAMAKRPRLLLLDEPVAALDPLARREFMQALMGVVAESGTTVLLSSHLVADLERVCDYLIVLQKAHVRLVGSIDELLDEHRTLVGPRTEPGAVPMEGPAQVVSASHTDRQSTLLVRTKGRPVDDPAWTQHEVTLEDLVLAYLHTADTRGVRTASEVAA
ncbi:ABC transporter ATP-binding protein [Streptomyces sp. NPDC056390]|uniref:ABC transporter ATP-binding protein n=1 Tax=Streptomyces sp. NPDC056390 TaxID=3345806 RepID=UPI0035DD26C1